MKTAWIRSVMALSSRISSGRTSRVPLGMRSIVPYPLRATSGERRNVVQPFDPRPELAETLVDPLVPAVDVTDVADLGNSLRTERGDQHRHPCADVWRVDPLAGEAARPEHNRSVRVADRDRGTHQLELVTEEQPVLEHLLVDHN